MAIAINTNIASLNAQRNLNSSQAGTNEALQRLSSGLRINSAKDDAAGLAISTRFESQIKGLGVAIRNAGDGVSLAQTAEGSLGSMTENLQRVRELALQAANGTNSAADREALQAEAALLIEEIGRVSTGANFNGVNLLDGSLETSFQVGANAGETISVSIGKLTADTLGVSQKSGVSSSATSSALAGGDLVINGITVGASRASDDTASTSLASASAISKAAAINRVSDQSGVTAVVDANTAAGSTMTAAALSGTITLNGTAIDIETTGDAASSRSAVVTAINAQSSLTGITAVDTGDDALGVSLVAEDGRNIELSLGALTTASTGLSASGTYTGGVTLVANSGTNNIEISGSNTAAAGLASGSFTAGVATVSSTGQVAAPGAAATAGEVAGTSAANLAFDFSQGTAAELATLNGGVQLSATGTNFSVATAAAATVTSGVNLSTFANDFTSDASPAVLTGTVNLGTGVDFTGVNAVAFRLSTVDGANFDVTVNGNFTDAAVGGGAGSGNTALAANINGQLVGSGFTASVVGGNLTFTQDTASDQTVIFTSQFASADADTVFGFTSANDTAVGSAETAVGSFDLEIDGLGTQTINLTTNIANSAGLLTAINNEILADFGSQAATASLDGNGNLVITSATSGATSEVTVSNLQGSLAAGAILGLQNGATDLGSAANDIAFTITTTAGGVDNVTLDSDYTDAANGGTLGAGNTALLADVNAAIAGSGFTASLNADRELVFTENANLGATITFNNNGGSVSSVLALGIGEGATDTGVIEDSPTNATFDVYVNGGTVQSVNVNNNVASASDLLTEINGQLTGATASINDDGELVITSNTTGAASSVQIANLGGNAAAELGLVATSDSGTAATAASFNNLDAGDLVINGINIGASRASDDTASYDGAASSSKEASGISIAAAINRSTESTGVTATVNATETVGTAATAGTAGDTATLYINGVDVGLTVQANADSNRAFAVAQINAAAGQTGVIAEDNGSSVTLRAADGRNISLAMNTNGGATAANFGLGGVGSSDFGSTAVNNTTANGVANTTYSTVTLSAAGTIDVSGGTNGNDDLAALGFQKGAFGGAVSGQFLTEVDISTQKGATDALAAIDNALNSVNAARADLGAVQNRFEATISNLEINSENLSAANSRIRDADFAAEAANLARFQVLQQAGISILSQANSSGEQVLSLLR